MFHPVSTHKCFSYKVNNEYKEYIRGGGVSCDTNFNWYKW